MLGCLALVPDNQRSAASIAALLSSSVDHKMADEIFRKAALERLATPDRLDQPLRITSPAAWIVLVALLCLLLTVAFASAFIVVPVKISGEGIIISPTGVADVPIESGGRLVSLLARPGQRVEPGTTVARIDQPALRAQLEQAEADEGDLSQARARIVEFQSRAAATEDEADTLKRRDLEQNLRLAQQKLSWRQERASLQEQLFAKNNTTRQNLIDTKIESGNAEQELAVDIKEINQIELNKKAREIAFQRELLEQDLKLSAASRKRQDIFGRLERASRVESPFAGTVVEIKRNVGDLLEPNTPLLSLLTDDLREGKDANGLVAILYLSAAEGKKVREGMVVQVSPSTVRREEYGFLLGSVSSVATVPSTEDGMMRILRNKQLVQDLAKAGAPIEVEVALQTDPGTPSGYRWSSGTGPAVAISPSTLTQGQVEVRHQRLAEIVLPALHHIFSDDE
jgi:HlyD family secretion protein